MEYHNKVYVSEGIDVNKTSTSKECIIYHYRKFLSKGFSNQQPAMAVMMC